MKKENKQEERKDYSWLRWMITIFAIVVLLIRVVFPNLTIDAVSLGLIILALAPWLSPIIKSIEIAGVGKIELQELKSQVEQLHSAVLIANLQADLATAHAIKQDQPGSDYLPKQRLSELAKKYVETRKTMKSGPERTTLMGRIFSEMVLQAINIIDFNFDDLLNDKDAGNRLSAYAYLFAKPPIGKLETVLNSVLVEAKPFNQYWGIQVIRKMINQMYPKEINKEIVEKLNRLLRTLEPGTDRYYETKSIIDSILN